MPKNGWQEAPGLADGVADFQGRVFSNVKSIWAHCALFFVARVLERVVGIPNLCSAPPFPVRLVPARRP